jgi:hypothetical protein
MIGTSAISQNGEKKKKTLDRGYNCGAYSSNSV